VRRGDGALGYVDCDPARDAQWFAFRGGKCAAVGMGIDVAGALKAARMAANSGDFKAAVAGFDAILAASPGRTTYLSERGYLRYKAGDLAGAMLDLQAARTTYPEGKTRGIIQFNLGLVKAAQGDKQGALQAFQSANHLRPSKAAKAKIAELTAILKK
jgi:tetratricopeptide (TPR) repeat protein